MNFTPPKLKPLHIAIIAVVLALIVGAALAKFWILPITTENKALEASVASLQDQGSDQALEQANELLKTNKAKAANIRARYQNEQNRYFRIGPNRQPLDLSDRFRALNTLSREQAETLGPIIERWVRSTGNRLTAGPSVAAAPADPNDIPKEVLRIRITGLKVQGSFPSIMRLLRSTPSLPRLVTIDSVKLASAASDTSGAGQLVAFGRQDTVSADVDLTVYIFPINGDKAKPFKMPAGEGGAGGGGLPSAPSLPGGPPVGPPPGGPPMPGGPPAGPPPGGPPLP